MHRRAVKLAVAAIVLTNGVFLAGYLGCDGSGADRTRLKLPLPPPPERVVLLITGDTDGNLEPCNCPGQRRGGLSRRKTLLDTLAGQFGPTVLLDNGNAVLCSPNPETVTDHYIWAGMGRLGYDAVAVGDQELDRGASEFAAAAAEAKLPLVATNVTFSDGRPIGPAYRMIRRGGRNILVLSVIGPGMVQLSSAKVREQIKLADPADAVNRTLAELAADPRADRADVVVLLAILESNEREGVVARLSGVDLAVLSTEADHPVELEKIGQTPIIYAPAGGRQIAAVVFGGRANISSNPGIVARPPSGVSAQPGAAAPHMTIQQVAAFPVERSLPRDQRMWELYQAYTYDAQQHMWGMLIGKAGQTRFVQSAECGRCHAIQYQWWLRQPHARAWATIAAEGRTSDPECLRCHTTGYGYPAGFKPVTPPSGDGREAGKPDAAAGPPLANVGCQSCHQIDLAAHQSAAPPKHVPRVEERACKACHTDARSPDFDLATYAPKATCPRLKGKPAVPAG